MKTIVTLIFALIFTSNIATAQDTLYIYKSGAVITKFAVAKIDSLIFYKSGASSTGNTVSDIDGNIYHTVKIGTQVWMVENLKTTKYLNGEDIPNVTDQNIWDILKIGAQCNYNNDTTLGEKYGKLYNWYAVNDNRNIAPQGWHVPTDAEWTTLTNYVAANLGTSASVAKVLAAKTDWNLSTTIGAVGNDLTKNNASGFMALPAGIRISGGIFKSIKDFTFWWSSTQVDANYAKINSMNYGSGVLSGISSSLKDGFSVRCVRD